MSNQSAEGLRLSGYEGAPMKSQSLKAVTEVTCLAPQFLVDDLSEAIGYYSDRLGFEPDFVYESFYASVSRDGFSFHNTSFLNRIAQLGLQHVIDSRQSGFALAIW